MLEIMYWMNPAVHFIGLCISVWAFYLSRKWGYFLTGIYFVMVLFSLLAMPQINQMLTERRAPDPSENVKEEMRTEVNKTIDQVLQKHGLEHTGPVEIDIYVPFGPIVLVVGLWLIAKRERKTEQVSPPYD